MNASLRTVLARSGSYFHEKSWTSARRTAACWEFFSFLRKEGSSFKIAPTKALSRSRSSCSFLSNWWAKLLYSNSQFSVQSHLLWVYLTFILGSMTLQAIRFSGSRELAPVASGRRSSHLHDGRVTEIAVVAHDSDNTICLLKLFCFQSLLKLLCDNSSRHLESSVFIAVFGHSHARHVVESSTLRHGWGTDTLNLKRFMLEEQNRSCHFPIPTQNEGEHLHAAKVTWLEWSPLLHSLYIDWRSCPPRRYIFTNVKEHPNPGPVGV